jgi:DNA-binding transcriptional LysR family regulator
MKRRHNLVDLNLLAYFEALLEEGHVSRAAQRMGLSQPAMSLALKRLREMFGDPLLVQTPKGLVPTMRAQVLLERVRELLHQSHDLLLLQDTFDPANATETFIVVATNFVASMFMPQLVARFERDAPNAQIILRTATPYRAKQWFEDGSVDLGISYVVSPPEELHIAPLRKERLVCIARRGHKLVKGSVTLDQLCTVPHVKLRPSTPPYESVLDRLLASLGREVRIGHSVTDFLLVPPIVRGSDLIAVVPERLVEHQEKGLQVMALPVDLPELTLSMVWHERTHREPSQQWLRSVVKELARDP